MAPRSNRYAAYRECARPAEGASAGIGQLAWQAIQRVDIPIIMGVTLVSACFIVLGNLIADLIAPLVDPRIRLK